MCQLFLHTNEVLLSILWAEPQKNAQVQKISRIQPKKTKTYRMQSSGSASSPGGTGLVDPPAQGIQAALQGLQQVGSIHRHGAKNCPANTKMPQ